MELALIILFFAAIAYLAGHGHGWNAHIEHTRRASIDAANIKAEKERR